MMYHIEYHDINGISYPYPMCYPQMNTVFCPTVFTDVVGNRQDCMVVALIAVRSVNREWQGDGVGQLV